MMKENLDNETNELIYDSTSLEKLGVHIDMMKAIKTFS